MNLEIFTHPLLTALIGMIAPTILIYFWNLFLSREQVYNFGYRLMRALMTFTFERTGEAQGREINSRICNTLTDLTSGMRDATLGTQTGPDHASDS